METQIKKPKKMRRINDSLYRKYKRRDSQILRAKVLVREVWRILSQVK